MYNTQGDLPTDPIQYVIMVLVNGWPFAVSILGILGAHEFGHYLAGRYHGVHVTLPYFIPFPSFLGTMGAFINMKEPPKNRKILLDIGIAGPLAGLIVAIPVLLIGLSLSQVSRLRVNPGEMIQMEGNSLLYLFSKFLIFGKFLPEPASFGGCVTDLILAALLFYRHPLPDRRAGCEFEFCRLGRLGWAAGHRDEPDPGRPVGRRSYAVCFTGSKTRPEDISICFRCYWCS